jgi:hypothetical protein
MQPIHATSDRDLADRYWGPERTKRAYPWRTLLASGARLAFGSDAPVEPIDPLLGIYAAVARRRPGDEDAWTPQQKLTLDEALAATPADPPTRSRARRRAGRSRWEWSATRRSSIATSHACPRLTSSRRPCRATVTAGIVRYESGLG